MLISLLKLLNEDVDNNLKVVYPGRFQPFSLHHLGVYRNFVEKFGRDTVYIATSNKTDSDTSPFDFIGKKEIMKALGVPGDKIIKVLNTYAPIRNGNLTPGWESILNPGDKLLVILGEKDANRFRLGKGYYQKFTSESQMEDYTQNGYVLTHHIDIEYRNVVTGEVDELNGTLIRNLFRDEQLSTDEKFDHFKSLYKTNNKKLFNYMNKILNKNKVSESVIAESGIKHVEDLKPNDLLDLLDSWNIDNKKFEVTEKVDGREFYFGENQDGFYVSSRTQRWTSVKDYPSLYFFDDFKKYHSLLEGINFIDIVGNVLNRDVTEVKFSGEAIASYDSNIILYDTGIIGDGVYITFMVQADEETLTRSDLEIVIKEINKQSVIKFYTNFVVDAKNIKFEEKYITTLRTIIEKHGNILKKPARKPEDKALKNKVKKIINLIGQKSKESFLGTMSDYQSFLGGDHEGFVVKLPDGNLVKFVDKSKFLATKKLNWKYIDGLSILYRKFTSELKNNPMSLKSAFKQLSSGTKDLYDEFKRGDESEFTIPKRKEDTKKSFKIYFDRMNKIKQLLGAEDDQVLVSKILNKQLGESLMSEGGKTFPDMKEIKNEYVIPTIKLGLKNLNMEDLEYALVGNYKKPVLGDIDVAVDGTQLAQIIGSRFDSPEDKNQFFADLKSYIDKNKTEYIIDYRINKGLQQFSAAIPAVDTSNNLVPDTNVQIDVMIGDREWMRRALGPAVDSKYKAAHRNFLYTAAFSQIEMVTDEVDVKRKYQFSMKHGVETVDFIYDGKGKRVKLGKNLLTGNVEDMVHILFDESVSFDDVNSFEELYKMMLTSKFKYPGLRDKIFSEFVVTVQRMKLPVPHEIKKYE